MLTIQCYHYWIWDIEIHNMNTGNHSSLPWSYEGGIGRRLFGSSGKRLHWSLQLGQRSSCQCRSGFCADCIRQANHEGQYERPQGAEEQRWSQNFAQVNFLLEIVSVFQFIDLQADRFFNRIHTDCSRRIPIARNSSPSLPTYRSPIWKTMLNSRPMEICWLLV